MTTEFREGIIVRNPFERISDEEIRAIDKASLKILEEAGILCYNEEAVDIFGRHSCHVERNDHQSYRIRIPNAILKDVISSAPSRVKLGARDPKNSLILDAEVPRVYFGSGSETNIWLDTDFETFVSENDQRIKRNLPVYTRRRGTVAHLSTAARLAEELDHLDFFIRPVNIQDEDVNEDNHDVNKFYASLSNITKHVQAGLTNIEKLEDVLRMARIIAGGEEALRQNPLISFITCTIKSPLQMVNDATQKLIEIAKRGVPLVISSSPQGGSTAPIQEAGMVIQINAEILAGIALSQMVNPGTPVLYGSVPVRARMDNLHDMYGAPEFNQYNIDCIQMARYYRIPCYSTAGVGDTEVPGVQATVEKFMTHMPIAMAGAQYVHYAFGLLERTNIFCPVQAVMDDQHIGMIKWFLSSPKMGEEDLSEVIAQIKKVMESKQKLYVRFVRKSLRTGCIYSHYPFEGGNGDESVVEKARERMKQLLSKPRKNIDPDVREEIFRTVPGILSRLKEK